MNERIKDIIEQNCVTEYYAGILCWRFSESQLKKFAELIVQECAEFADKGTRGGIGELMKSHFGENL
jgi:hypothetical protein